MSEIEEKLAAIQAERKALETARAEREAAQSAKEELANAARELEDLKAIDDAEQKYGKKEIATVQTDLGVVIVKRCNATLWKRFQDTGTYTYAEVEQLVSMCLVYPDASTFDVWCRQQPAITVRAGDAVATLAGVRKVEQAKK